MVFVSCYGVDLLLFMPFMFIIHALSPNRVTQWPLLGIIHVVAHSTYRMFSLY